MATDDSGTWNMVCIGADTAMTEVHTDPAIRPRILVVSQLDPEANCSRLGSPSRFGAIMYA